MRIAEIYKSLQGEGLLTGTESAFLRTSGCNLRCWYCDTPYTSWNPTGDDLAVSEIVRQVNELDCHHVVITGGEPMLHAEMIPVCQQLHDAGHHITIETAGTLFLPVECNLMAISPKLANSDPSPDDHPDWNRRHRRTRHAPGVIRKLVSQYHYQFKFVIDTPRDCEQVALFLEEFPEIHRDRIYLMPQGTTADELEMRSEWLRPYCEANRFRFCPRMQIEWFGLRQGT